MMLCEEPSIANLDLHAGRMNAPSASVKFTIITSTFNAGHLLASTAKSLNSQSNRNFEWIIIDGASRDNTIEVAHGFDELISVLISEPDNGIYDAWNKALPHIRGDWVLFLGAGDELHESDTLQQLAELLPMLPGNITLAYGKVMNLDASGVPVSVRDETWEGLDGRWVIGRPVLPCHQGVLHKATLFQHAFRFDTRFKIAADSELLLRELIGNRGYDIGIIVSHFLRGGISDTMANRFQFIGEVLRVNARVGILHRRPFYLLFKFAVYALKDAVRRLPPG